MNKSDSIAKLAKALSCFQFEIKDPLKDGKANYGSYVTLDDLLDSIRPTLSKNGLSFIQMPGGDGQTITITTIILHESGEWIECEPFSLKAVKCDPQGAGSAVTYGRRYSLSAAFGVAWDTDDDGQKACEKVKPVSKVLLEKLSTLCKTLDVDDQHKKELIRNHGGKITDESLTAMIAELEE